MQLLEIDLLLLLHGKQHSANGPIKALLASRACGP